MRPHQFKQPKQSKQSQPSNNFSANRNALFPLAIELSQTIINLKKPADYIIASYFKDRHWLSSFDRKFIAQLVYQALRERIYLLEIVRAAAAEIRLPVKFFESAIIYLCAYRQKNLATEELDGIFAQLTSLPRQILTKLIAFYHAHEQLDFIIDDELAKFSARHSFPQWLTKELLPCHSLSELAELFDRSNTAAPLCLRVNSYKTTTAALQLMLKTERIETQPGALSPFALIVDQQHDIFSTKSFHSGLFEVQDEGSQLVSILLNARPNARVLDACAGAGGKTLHLAALMKGRGEVFAYDINSHRLANIHRRIQRAGLQNIRVLDKPTSFDQFKQRYYGKLDGVIVDAPCSGSGTLRRSPDIKLKISPELLRELNGKQCEILDNFAEFVKPGGRLLYATCSILPSENRAIVEDFLSRHANFNLKPIGEALDEMRIDFDLSGLKTIAAGQEFLQLYPHKHNTDGFFVALMQKHGSTEARKFGS